MNVGQEGQNRQEGREGQDGRRPQHVQLAYSDTGRGTPLLCLHGGMGIDGAALRVPGILGLADHGVRVIVPDQRGHGDSDRSDPALYSHDTWVSDARAFMLGLGLARFALLGHSYGGFLAIEYALRWPESLTHLILVGTSAGPVHASTEAVATDEELRRRLRASWPRFFAADDKHWPLFESLRFSADSYNAAFTRELPRYDVRAQMASLRTPTLLVVGAADPYRPHMEWLVDTMPQAKLLVFESAGHFPFIEQAPEFTREVSAFLNG
jgi:proline iminopeptidase